MLDVLGCYSAKLPHAGTNKKAIFWSGSNVGSTRFTLVSSKFRVVFMASLVCLLSLLVLGQVLWILLCNINLFLGGELDQ